MKSTYRLHQEPSATKGKQSLVGHWKFFGSRLSEALLGHSYVPIAIYCAALTVAHFFYLQTNIRIPGFSPLEAMWWFLSTGTAMILALLHPRLGVFLAGAMMGFRTVPYSLPGIWTSPADGIAIATIISFFIYSGGRQLLAEMKTSIGLGLLCLVLAGTISAAINGSSETINGFPDTYTETLGFAAKSLFFLCAIALAKQSSYREAIGVGLGVGATIVCVTGFIALFFIIMCTAEWSANGVWTWFYRPAFIAGQNGFAMISVAALPFLFYLYCSELRSRWKKALWGTIAALIALATGFVDSTTASVTLIVVLLAWVLLTKLTSGALLKFIMVLCVIASFPLRQYVPCFCSTKIPVAEAASCTLSGESSQKQTILGMVKSLILEGPENNARLSKALKGHSHLADALAIASNDVNRATLLDESLGAIKAHPLIGIGRGNLRGFTTADQSAHRAHNLFLTTFSETGVLGGIGLLVFLAGSAAVLARLLFRNVAPPWSRFGFISLLVLFIWTNTHDLDLWVGTWTTMAFLIGVARVASKSTNGPVKSD